MNTKQRGYLFLNALEDFITSYNYVAPIEDEYIDYEDKTLPEEMDDETFDEDDKCSMVECNDEKAYKEFLKITRLHQKQCKFFLQLIKL